MRNTSAALSFELHLLFLLAIFAQPSHSRPSSHGYTTDGTELIVVEEVVRCTRQDLHELCQNATTTQTQQHQQRHTAISADNESAMDIMDDLIYLENKPHHRQQQQQQRKEKQQPYGTYQQQQQHDMLSPAAAREDTLVAAAAAAPAVGDPSDSTALGSSYRQEPFDSDSADSDRAAENADDRAFDAANAKTTDVDAVNAAAADEIIADGVLFHGVLLRLADGPRSIPQPLPPIDMSAFVSLIPVAEVKSIATNYYNSDAEVRRAYAYLSGRDFIALRQEIVASPEVGAFLQYLNISGFDVLKFVSTIANLTTINVTSNARNGESAMTRGEAVDSQNSLLEQQQYPRKTVANDVSKIEDNLSPITNIISSATQTKAVHILKDKIHAIATTTTKTTKLDEIDKNEEEEGEQKEADEELNDGLHGLVDSILEILPQDQILATFFDKLESDENFRKFVNNIQKPPFAEILSKMEQSMSLRNLIFTLHNNGIYITRIVDSLKSYFFLGGFS